MTKYDVCLPHLLIIFNVLQSKGIHSPNEIVYLEYWYIINSSLVNSSSYNDSNDDH